VGGGWGGTALLLPQTRFAHRKRSNQTIKAFGAAALDGQLWRCSVLCVNYLAVMFTGC